MKRRGLSLAPWGTPHPEAERRADRRGASQPLPPVEEAPPTKETFTGTSIRKHGNTEFKFSVVADLSAILFLVKNSNCDICFLAVIKTDRITLYHLKGKYCCRSFTIR